MSEKKNGIEYGANKSIELKSLAAVDLSKEQGDSNSYEVYLKSLLWGIENEDTKNIALMGSYGVGKSSIIKTMKAINEGNLPKNITISLATFENERVSQNVPDKSDEEVISEEKISLSIVNQILYSNKKTDLPESRFKRIEYIDLFNKSIIVFVAALFLYSFLFLFLPELSEKIAVLPSLGECTKIFFVLVFCIGIFALIWKSFSFFTNLSISKISPTSIELKSSDKEVSVNALDKFFDEILYFFQATKTQLVFIEDLDRFPNSLKIFIKLRELNFLLNQSKDIEEKITFIYAVKDDVIDNHCGKAKFFDLIIPIIPYINYSNSRNIFKKEFCRVEPSLEEDDRVLDLLNLVSRYIEDTRTIFTIVNDYVIMRDVLGTTAKLNSVTVEHKVKLLAFVIYKILYPQDYSMLLLKKGILYTLFSKKEIFINSIVENIENKLSESRKELERFKELQKNAKESKKDLRRIFVSGLVEYYNDDVDRLLKDFNIEKINDLINDETLFKDKVEMSRIQYHQYDKSNKYIGHFSYTFSSLEKHLEKNYQEELKALDYKKEIIESKKAIEEAEKNSNSVRIQSIEGLFKISKQEILANFYNIEKENSNKVFKDNEKIDDDSTEYKVLTLLLEEGYISENFISFLSHTYEGVLSLTDQEFYQKFGYNIADVNYVVNKPKVVLKDLSIHDFKQKTIINHSLLLEVFNNQNNFKRFEFAIVHAFREYIQELEKLVFTDSKNKYLSKLSSLFIINESYFYILGRLSLKDNKIVLLNSLESCNDNDIVVLNKNEEFKALMLNKETTFLECINNNVFKKFIKHGKYLLEDCTYISSKEKIKAVIDSKCYVFNVQNISYLIESLGTNIEDFVVYSITTIMSNNQNTAIKEYFLENRDIYFKSYFAKLKENVESIQEDENVIAEYFIGLEGDLLLNDELELVCKKVNFKITDLDQFFHRKSFSYLLKYNRIIASWKNIFFYYIGSEYSNFEEDLKLFIEQNKDNLKTDFDEIDNDDFKYAFINSSVDFKIILKVIKESKFIIDDIEKLDVINSILMGNLIVLKKIPFNQKTFESIDKEQHLFYLVNYVENFDRLKELTLTYEDILEVFSFMIDNIKEVHRQISKEDYNLMFRLLVEYLFEFCKEDIDFSNSEVSNKIYKAINNSFDFNNSKNDQYDDLLNVMFNSNISNKQRKEFIELFIDTISIEKIKEHCHNKIELVGDYLSILFNKQYVDKLIVVVEIFMSNYYDEITPNLVELLIKVLELINNGNKFIFNLESICNLLDNVLSNENISISCKIELLNELNKNNKELEITKYLEELLNKISDLPEENTSYIDMLNEAFTDKKVFKIIDSKGGKIVEGAKVYLIYENLLFLEAVTDKQGVCIFTEVQNKFKIVVSADGYDLFIGDMVNSPVWNKINLVERENGGTLVVKGWGKIAGFEGGINPIKDNSGRTYFYTDNIKVDNMEITSSSYPFELNKDYLLEDVGGNKIIIKFIDIIGVLFLIEYMRIE